MASMQRARLVALLALLGVGSGSRELEESNLQLYPCSSDMRIAPHQRFVQAPGGTITLAGGVVAAQRPQPVNATTCPGESSCINLVVSADSARALRFVRDPSHTNSTFRLRTSINHLPLCMTADWALSHGYLPNVFLGPCESADTWLQPAAGGLAGSRTGGVRGLQCLDVSSGGSSIGHFSLPLMPARAAFNSSEFASWGGSVLPDDRGQYHMFAAVFANGDGLKSWTTTSEIMHATADTPEGPFTAQEIVAEPFAHNPQVARANDGTYLLFMIGGHKMMSAVSLNGPWTPVEGFSQVSCNNPAPVIVPGSDVMYCVCHGGPWPNHWGISVEMLQAPSWRGPWTTWRRNQSDPTIDLYDGGTALFAHPVEDPTVWVGSDGRWHLLCHAFRMGMVNSSGRSRNAYGGYAWAPGPHGPWHFQENLLAYVGEIEFEDGSSWEASRRERPKVLLDPSTRMPSHLYTGVCPPDSSFGGVHRPGHCFTLVQRVDTSSASAPWDSSAPAPVPPVIYCGVCENGGKPPLSDTALTLQCMQDGATISAINFVSYGNPKSVDNVCGTWSVGTCNAANSSSVVKTACLGQPSCTVYPNTTSFGDPCFGTAKKLVVELQCSAGSGVGKCRIPPPPPPPPAPPSTAAVTVDWGKTQNTVSTHASLQVVSHRYLERGSPIHNASFSLLRDLQPQYARYVPWFTHELAFSGCEPTAPTGIGTADCTSSWNCTLADEMMADFWEAVDGDHSQAIPNFSTQPSWLYKGGSADLQALGDYYGRLLAWYTRGGVKDECGLYHHSGHAYNITIWEVFNEPIAEHSHTMESYTAEFDAVVKGIRKWADPEHRIKFVGLNLANIRPAAQVQQWVRYFLTPSNHAEECRDALDYIAYHSYPTNSESVSSDPTTLTHFFDYYDAFVSEVKDTAALSHSLSPSTGTVLDECGTLRVPPFDDPSDPTKSGGLYWVASGAGFAYLYLRIAALELTRGVAVVGMSQLMDDVTREPGVTMIDWTNGKGTARYWVLRLIREAVAPGDKFLTTTATAGIHAQGVIGLDGAKRVVVVNKQYTNATVAIQAGSEGECYALVVDTTSGEGAPRKVNANDQFKLGPYASAIVYL